MQTDMKRTRDFCTVFLTSLFWGMLAVGCGEADDPTPSPLIGTWQSFSASVTQCDDPKMDISEHTCPQCSRFQFTQDSFTLEQYGNKYAGTYTINGNVLSLPAMASTQYPELTEQLFKIVDGKLVLSFVFKTSQRAGCLRHMNYNKVE